LLKVTILSTFIRQATQGGQIEGFFIIWRIGISKFPSVPLSQTHPLPVTLLSFQKLIEEF